MVRRGIIYRIIIMVVNYIEITISIGINTRVDVHTSNYYEVDQRIARI